MSAPRGVLHFAADDGHPACSKHTHGGVTAQEGLTTCFVCQLQLRRKHRGPVRRERVTA